MNLTEYYLPFTDKLKAKLSGLRLKHKLIAAFLLVSLVPIILIILIVLIKSSSSINNQVYAQLEAVREIKKSAVERYFNHIKEQVSTMAINPYVVGAMEDFSPAFFQTNFDNNRESMDSLKEYYELEFSAKYQEENGGKKIGAIQLYEKIAPIAKQWQNQYIAQNQNPLGSKHELLKAGDGSTYSQVHESYHPYFKRFLERFGYYDIFLADIVTGNIVYSVFKELDYATSLLTGPYANSNIAQAFRRASRLDQLDAYAIVDYQSYLPSYDAPASFIAAPIFNSEKRKIGVLIFQMPIDALNQIMGERSGLGKTGETYLVGPDSLMRSDSYLDPVNHSVVSSFRNPTTGKVDTVATQLAMSGKTGQKIITDYNGNSVLSSFTPIDVLGMKWLLLSEIDKAEAFAQVNKLTYMMIVVLIIAVVLIILIAVRFSDSLTRPIKRLVQTMHKVEEQGDFSVRVPKVSKDEIGIASEALNQLLDALQVSISATNSVMNDMAAGVFDRRIDVECKGELETLKQATNNCANSLALAIREVNGIVGNMSHGDFSGKITATLDGDLAAMKENINLTVSSLDQTVSEIVSVMAAINQGNFKSQVTCQASGQLLLLKNNINSSVTLVDKALNEISDVMNAISRGNFSQRVEQPMTGQLELLKNNINSSVENLANVIVEVTTVMSAMSEGNFKAQVTLSTSGQLQQLKNNVNSSMTSVDTALSEISEVMHAIRQGNFRQRIQQPLTGQLDQLKENINSSVDNLGTVISEIASVMSAMKKGDFSLRILASSHGQLQSLQEDINTSMDITATAITNVTDVLASLSNGDLSKKIEQNYDGVFQSLKNDVNQTVEKLTLVISGIQNASDAVTEGASEIANSNTELSQRAEEQATNLEQASESIAQMLDSITQVASKASYAVSLSENAESTASEGGLVADDTVKAIDAINASSKDINEIVSVIDELAFQTNLLALNAAVEAARAGDYGRSFAVVANEVRNLASRSASAAKDIKSIISDSNQKVNQGTKLANLAGDNLTQIVAAVTDVNANIIGISDSTRDQKNAIGQVDTVVQRLTHLMQENSSIAEETMAAAKSLTTQAAEMKKLLGYFSNGGKRYSKKEQAAI